MDKQLIPLTSCAFNFLAALPPLAITHVGLVNLTDCTCLRISIRACCCPAVPATGEHPSHHLEKPKEETVFYHDSRCNKARLYVD